MLLRWSLLSLAVTVLTACASSSGSSGHAPAPVLRTSPAPPADALSVDTAQTAAKGHGVTVHGYVVRVVSYPCPPCPPGGPPCVPCMPSEAWLAAAAGPPSAPGRAEVLVKGAPLGEAQVGQHVMVKGWFQPPSPPDTPIPSLYADDVALLP